MKSFEARGTAEKRKKVTEGLKLIMSGWLYKKIISWWFLLGILLVVNGMGVIVSGRIKNVIVLGDERYFVGIVSLVSGFYVLYQNFRK